MLLLPELDKLKNNVHLYQNLILFSAVTEISTVSKLRFTIREFVSGGKYTDADYFLRFCIRKDSEI